MAVLLMRLAGPMQSWGTRSRFSERDTGLEPSKSGVIGLICAALGRSRDLPVDDLAELTMAVRVDCEGVIKKDYHTARHILKACGSGIKECELSNRYYLSDADFLVAFSGDASLLQKIHEYLFNPVWQIFLGRKSFLPSVPVVMPNGLKKDADDGLEVLKNEPWPRSDLADYTSLPRNYKRMLTNDANNQVNLRFVCETPFGIGEQVVCDQPVGSAFSTRQFTIRHITTIFDTVGVREEMIQPCISQG